MNERVSERVCVSVSRHLGDMVLRILQLRLSESCARGGGPMHGLLAAVDVPLLHHLKHASAKGEEKEGRERGGERRVRREAQEERRRKREGERMVRG